jgi:signal transduction histidine kinase
VNAPALRSIQSKLLALFLLATLVPLGSGLVVAAVEDLRRLEQDLVDRVSKLASVVEEYSAADLAFEDADAAREALAKVARLEEVRGAALYLNTGKQFATYHRLDLAESAIPVWVNPAIERRVEVLGDRVVVYEPVIHRNQRYGTFYLEASTGRLRERAQAYRRGLAIVGVGLLALYGLLALVLQRLVLRPLGELTDIARKLAKTGDYSLRARKRSEDELGVLAETLNSMLAEVERRQGEAREALKARDDFLSVASHELKTPLTTLKLLTQRLQGMFAAQKETPDREQLPRMLSSYARQLLRLEKLVGQLLDVTRIAGGRLQLEPEVVDLTRLVTELVERFRDELAQAGCALTLTAGSPVLGRWDPFRVDQVVSNLLSNAIKYGAGKPIEVLVTQDASRGFLVVRDHGIGIAPEEQARIFAPFERVVSDRHYGGLGLGLYIAASIVAAHGGRISVDSKEGQGSTFTVELPRGQVG